MFLYFHVCHRCHQVALDYSKTSLFSSKKWSTYGPGMDILGPMSAQPSKKVLWHCEEMALRSCSEQSRAWLPASLSSLHWGWGLEIESGHFECRRSLGRRRTFGNLWNKDVWALVWTTGSLPIFGSKRPRCSVHRSETISLCLCGLLLMWWRPWIWFRGTLSHTLCPLALLRGVAKMFTFALVFEWCRISYQIAFLFACSHL